MATTTLANTSALRKREQIAEGTMAFHLDKPAGFEFRAGQAIDLTLINPPETDSEGNTRTFSIASAPFDPDLMFATRMRDTACKRVLRSMPLGTEVKFMDPADHSICTRIPPRRECFWPAASASLPFSAWFARALMSGFLIGSISFTRTASRRCGVHRRSKGK